MNKYPGIRQAIQIFKENDPVFSHFEEIHNFIKIFIKNRFSFVLSGLNNSICGHFYFFNPYF